MPMGANGRRNDGSIRPAEWRRNGSKNAVAPPKTRSHQQDTACRHWETYNTRKNINNLHKINFCFYETKLNFVEKFAFDCWHNTVLWYTTNNAQHNKQYTTQNTQLLYNFRWNIYCIWLLAQHSSVIHNKQYTTQQTIHNTKYIVVIISFQTFFGRFWRGGMFELDWYRDRRQLNSLLTATENGC